MTDDEITPERRIELLGAALHAIAWQLVEDETDTSDRGVSEEHYRDALERAKTILPTLMPGVVAEEPEWEYGWRSRFATGGPVFQELEWGSREQAEQSIRDHEQWEADDPEESRLVYEIVKRTPAVRAGEWMPVKQEGTEQ